MDNNQNYEQKPVEAIRQVTPYIQNSQQIKEYLNINIYREDSQNDDNQQLNTNQFINDTYLQASKQEMKESINSND